jgi:hypothetical protein
LKTKVKELEAALQDY